jgi:hypothetical protein
MKAKFN